MKAYHGFMKFMQDEFGCSSVEAETEWEHRKAKPQLYKQDSKGWKGCIRAGALTTSVSSSPEPACNGTITVIACAQPPRRRMLRKPRC